MYNWSVDEEKIKNDPERYKIWRLEQLANFGLNGEKISEAELKKYWEKIKIDPSRRKFLQAILYER